MVTSYILVLIFSAWLTSHALLRVGNRLVTMMRSQMRPSPDIFALISAVLFLVVIGAPASMLVAVILLAVVQIRGIIRPLPPLARWGVPLVAALLAVAPATLPAIASLPLLASYALAFVVLFAITLSGAHLPEELSFCTIGLLASLLPLLAAPLLGAPFSIALDVALITAALLGVLMAADASARMSIARPSFALLTGWLIVQAALHGGWIAAGLSVLIYGGFLAYGLTHTQGKRHAF